MAAVSTRIADPFDLNLLDRQFAWLRANFPQPSAHEVVIVGMDQQTTEILREPLASRVVHAAWLEQMKLKDEARKYWQAAAAERPDEPRLKTLAE